MNLRDLRYVVAAADLLHFGRAAQACHVSQSTLSAQIAKLEDELGVKLFVREGRRIRVSPRGRPIIEEARRVIAAAQAMSAAAAAGRDPLEGPLRLGVIATVCPYLAPYLLPAALASLPKAPIVLVEDVTEALLRDLVEGKLDAAVIASDPQMERLDETLLYDEAFFLVVSAPETAPGVAEVGRAVAPDEIDAGRLLLLADGHCLRDQALDLCGEGRAAAGLGDLRAASLETIFHLVRAGYGVTLAPQLAVAAWRGRPGFRAFPIAEGAGRRVRLVFRRDTPRKAAMAALGRLIARCLPDEAGVTRVD